MASSSWNFLLKCNHCKRHKIDPDPNTHILVLYLPCSSVALWSLWFMSEGLILIWTNCQDSIISLHNCELIRFDRLIFVLWDMGYWSRKAHESLKDFESTASQVLDFGSEAGAILLPEILSHTSHVSFLTPCFPVQQGQDCEALILFRVSLEGSGQTWTDQKVESMAD